jgi:hypothetical protein
MRRIAEESLAREREKENACAPLPDASCEESGQGVTSTTSSVEERRRGCEQRSRGEAWFSVGADSVKRELENTDLTEQYESQATRPGKPASDHPDTPEEQPGS